MPLLCDVAIERWPLAEPFEIAREVLTDIDTICVRLTDAQGRVGRGEAVGVTYDGETPATLQAQIRSIGSSLPDDLGFDDLTSVLPPGGARNALDCALWDLRARQASRRFWTLAGWHVVQPVTTVYTIGLGSETQVRRWVRAARHLPVLKLKADGLRHLDMVRIAREEHPTARLLIDANQAWSPIAGAVIASPGKGTLVSKI